MNTKTAVATAVAEAFPAPTSIDDNLPPPHQPKKDQGFVALDDDILVVLMKFSVKHLEDIPTGVMLRGTGDRDNIHAQDAIEAGKAHLAERNRHRPGRVDSGEAVLHVPSAQESIPSLRAAGYQVVDLHYYRNTKTEKYVIQIVFSRQVAKGDGLTFGGGIGEAEANAIRALEARAWEVWVWDNRAVGNPVTINLTGGHAPRVTKNPASSTKKLRIKDGVMKAHDE